jgi:hypothetical protein
MTKRLDLEGFLLAGRSVISANLRRGPADEMDVEFCEAMLWNSVADGLPEGQVECLPIWLPTA